MVNQTRRSVLAALGTVAVTGVAESPVAADRADEEATPPARTEGTEWPTYRADTGRTGSTVESAAPNGEYVEAAWTAESVYSYGSFPGEPVVADGAVYYSYQTLDIATGGGEGGVVAFDAETGEVRWRREGGPAGEAGIGTSRVASSAGGGRLYVVTFGPDDLDYANYGGLFALDTETGETRWSRTDIEGDEAVSLFSEGRLFLRDRALDAATGETLWRADAGVFVGIVDGRLYEFAGGSEILVRDPETGDVERSIAVEGTSRSLRDAALAAETLYGFVAEAARREVVAVSLRDGSVRWRWTPPTDDEPKPYVSRLAIGGDTVSLHASTYDDLVTAWEYGRGVQSTAYALDAATGDLRWEYDTPAVLAGDPSIAGDTVYVAGHARPKRDVDLPATPDFRFPLVTALSANDGTERWSYLVRDPWSPDESNTGVYSAMTPVIANGRVYVGGYMGTGSVDQRVHLTALAASGTATDSWNLPRSSTAPVARIAVDREGNGGVKRGTANTPEGDEYGGFDRGATVRLDASASTGSVERYEWRVGETASFETGGLSVVATLDFCGSLAVTLRVTGPDGRQSTSTVILSTAA